MAHLSFEKRAKFPIWNVAASLQEGRNENFIIIHSELNSLVVKLWLGVVPLLVLVDIVLRKL